MKQITTAFKQTLRYAFVGLLGLALLSSCKKDDPYNFEDTVAADVNLINASPDGPSAQLYVEDILRTPTAIAYSGASGYFKTYLGAQDVVIKSADGQSALTSSNVQIDAYNSYTFFLLGQSSSLGLLTVTDDLVAPAAGRAKIRYVNAAPNATSASLNSGSVVISPGQNFRGVSPSINITAGTFALSVVSGSVRSAVTNVNLENGKIYTIYAKGLVGGTGAAAFSIGVFINK